MRLSRTLTTLMLSAVVLIPTAAAVAPANAATSYTVTYSAVTGFGTQTVDATAGDTIKVVNASPTQTVFVSSVTPGALVAQAGQTVSFAVTTEAGTITAVGAGAQPVLVVR